jgi:hypothetical protein
MKTILLKFQNTITLISSILGLGYGFTTLYQRAVFAFDGIQNPFYELLAALIFETPIISPAILGLWYFRTARAAKVSIPIAFLIYGLLIALIIYLRMVTTDALAYGLPMVLIALPLCIIITVYLFMQFLYQKKDF